MGKVVYSCRDDASAALSQRCWHRKCFMVIMVPSPLPLSPRSLPAECDCVNGERRSRNWSWGTQNYSGAELICQSRSNNQRDRPTVTAALGFLSFERDSGTDKRPEKPQKLLKLNVNLSEVSGRQFLYNNRNEMLWTEIISLMKRQSLRI